MKYVSQLLLPLILVSAAAGVSGATTTPGLSPLPSCEKKEVWQPIKLRKELWSRGYHRTISPPAVLGVQAERYDRKDGSYVTILIDKDGACVAFMYIPSRQA